MKISTIITVLVMLAYFTLVPGGAGSPASDALPAAQPGAALSAPAPDANGATADAATSEPLSSAQPDAAASDAAQTWQNAPSVNDITAGTALALEPVDYAKVTISQFGAYEFKFSCKPTGEQKPPFKRAMVRSYLQDNYKVSDTTTYSYVIHWEEGQTAAEVVYPFTNDKQMKGEGYFYFCLLDENDVCISNIVMWEVAFT